MKIIKMCVKDNMEEMALLESRLGVCFYKVYDVNEMFQIINLVNFTPNLILINLDQLDGSNLLNFINTIKTLVSCNVKIENNVSTIAGIFSKDTNITIIKDAIDANISGLVPEGPEFTIEEQEHALRELITSNYHIPSDILEKIYQFDKTISTKIITYYSHGGVEAISNLKQNFMEKLQVNVNVNLVENLHNLFELLSDSNFHTDYVCLDINEIYKHSNTNVFEIIGTIKTIISCKKHQSSKQTSSKFIEIVAAIGEDIDPKKIREVLNIPTIAGVVLTIGNKVDINLMINSWKNIFDHKKEIPLLVKEWIKPKKTRILKDIDSITLTDRQSQVLALIQTRGSSNKVIAKTLNLSESTVKLHIGAILKSMAYAIELNWRCSLYKKANYC